MSQALAKFSETFDHARTVPARCHSSLLRLSEVPRMEWRTLADNAIEANGFFDPGFSVAAAKFARNGHGARALAAFSGTRLAGLIPVTSAARAFGLPLPVLVATQPYNTLTTPLLDRADPQRAAGALLDAARQSGAQLLVLKMVALQGPAYDAVLAAIGTRGLTVTTDNSYERAALATDLDAETYLRTGLGAKKLKELSRLGHRLADEGEIAYTLATTPDTVPAALDRFLELEARGWKGQRHTGLGQDEGDTAFVHAAAADLAPRGGFEVAELCLNGTTIAAGLIIKQADRALFFKIAYEETLARFSPGVQLTVELTRRFIEDPAIRFVDSTANAHHPMIDHVWRERLTVGDLYISTGPMGPALGKLIRLGKTARDQAERLLGGREVE